MKYIASKIYGMPITRRGFLAVCAAVLGFAACERRHRAGGPLVLGPAAGFGEGPTSLEIYRIQVMRSGNAYRAVSLVCTHQTCLLTPKPEGFTCPCHGSQFGRDGAVLTGPATVNLPWYRLSISEKQELLLHRAEQVGPEWKLEWVPS